jgi:hypothetical protein
MNLHERWQLFQQAGYAAASAVAPTTALDCFYLALLAFGQQDLLAAAAYGGQASRLEPDNLVYAQAARYLASLSERDKPNVYTLSDGFSAFIRGGGNLPLYAATSAALQQVYHDYATLNLLDIGAGDGLALLPALVPAVQRLDVVEPAASLLDPLRQQLAAQPLESNLWNCTIEEFSRTSDGQWDVAQATYSLQSLPPAQLGPVLTWLRQHTQRLLIVEFDVPDLGTMYAPERVTHMLERYAQGLAEYSLTRDLVAQGFLMPVLFGYFDPTAARTNYERPISQWRDQVQAAGFSRIQIRQLYPYWWTGAYLIDAR